MVQVCKSVTCRNVQSGSAALFNHFVIDVNAGAAHTRLAQKLEESSTAAADVQHVCRVLEGGTYDAIRSRISPGTRDTGLRTPHSGMPRGLGSSSSMRWSLLQRARLTKDPQASALMPRVSIELALE